MVGIGKINIHKCLFQFLAEPPGIAFVSVLHDIAPDKRNHIYSAVFLIIIFRINTVGAMEVFFYLSGKTSAKRIIETRSVSKCLCQMRASTLAAQLQHFPEHIQIFRGSN